MNTQLEAILERLGLMRGRALEGNEEQMASQGIYRSGINTMQAGRIGEQFNQSAQQASGETANAIAQLMSDVQGQRVGLQNQLRTSEADFTGRQDAWAREQAAAYAAALQGQANALAAAVSGGGGGGVSGATSPANPSSSPYQPIGGNYGVGGGYNPDRTPDNNQLGRLSPSSGATSSFGQAPQAALQPQQQSPQISGTGQINYTPMNYAPMPTPDQSLAQLQQMLSQGMNSPAANFVPNVQMPQNDISGLMASLMNPAQASGYSNPTTVNPYLRERLFGAR